MEAQVERLADKAWAKLQETSLSARVLLAVSGIPGSGKTTLASTVATGVNDRQHADSRTKFPNSPARSPSQPDVASFVPLDGYHLTRKQLNAMPNAEEAVFRRGAAFTFDGEGFVQLVEKLRTPMSPETMTIYAPSFDHAIRDPVENEIGIAPTTRMVIFEGLYTALDKEPWREAAKLMDELWFVEVDMDVAIARLVKGHVGSGISPDPEHARKRIMQSDMRNGKEILEFRLPVQEIVQSREDDSWKSSEIKQVEQEEEQKPKDPEDGQHCRDGRQWRWAVRVVIANEMAVTTRVMKLHEDRMSQVAVSWSFPCLAGTATAFLHFRPLGNANLKRLADAIEPS